MLCRGIRKGISERLEGCEVEVMKNKRYGICKPQHAESTLRANIKSWAKERESFDGVARSKKEIEEIVAEVLEDIVKGNAESACEFTNCDREVVR